MDLSELEKRHLKKLIRQLSEYRGRHTELVSVYIPQDYDMNKIISHLFQEQGTASNIKSTATRKNVTDALERMIQYLKKYKQTPPNGLAVFSGNVAEREGQSDVQVWAIEPQVPLNIRMYRCDKEFILEPLEDMLLIKDVYGLVVLDNRDADMALLKGKKIIHLLKTHREVPGKMKAGGQSAGRFSRARDLAKKEHYKKIADYMKDEFLNMPNLKGIIVGGPSITVTDFLNKEYITGDVEKKIIGTKDLSYTGLFGLQELVDKCDDLLAAEAIATEKKIMQKFFDLLAKEPGMVSYGKDEVKKNLNIGAVDTLLLSEELDDAALDEFEEAAEKLGTKIALISTETREGVQLKEMGKICAINRYNLEQ